MHMRKMSKRKYFFISQLFTFSNLIILTFSNFHQSKLFFGQYEDRLSVSIVKIKQPCQLPKRMCLYIEYIICKKGSFSIIGTKADGTEIHVDCKEGQVTRTPKQIVYRTKLIFFYMTTTHEIFFILQEFVCFPYQS